MLWRLTLTSLHFTTIYHLLAIPLTSFQKMFTIVWVFFFCVYGLAAVVSMLVSRSFIALLSMWQSIKSGRRSVWQPVHPVLGEIVAHVAPQTLKGLLRFVVCVGKLTVIR